MNLRPYIPGDEKKINPVEHTLSNHPDYQKRWDELVLPDWSWTRVADDGTVMGMGGIIPYDDSAYVWVMIDKVYIEREPSAVRGLEELDFMQKIVRFAESFKFGFLWTYIQDGFRKGEKLAKFLGFRRAERIDGCWLYRKDMSYG